MAWTETTIQDNKRYMDLETTAAITMTNTTPIASDVIVPQDIGSQRIFVGVRIVVAGSAAAADLDIEVSPDKTNWFTAVNNVIADTVPATPGLKMAMADLTGFAAPYYRLVWNNAAAAVGTVGSIKFKVVAKVPHSITNVATSS